MRKIRYMGHTLKELSQARHGRKGWRISRTGEVFKSLRAAKERVASRVFPYQGSTPMGDKR